MNLTADIISRYSDVDFISDEVACNVGDDNDNYVAKIIEKNYGAAVSFYEVFEGLVSEIEGFCGYRNIECRLYSMLENNEEFDFDLATKYVELLNSDSYLDNRNVGQVVVYSNGNASVRNKNNNDVLEMREYINDLITLVGVKEALEIASTFNPDNL